TGSAPSRRRTAFTCSTVARSCNRDGSRSWWSRKGSSKTLSLGKGHEDGGSRIAENAPTQLPGPPTGHDTGTDGRRPRSATTGGDRRLPCATGVVRSGTGTFWPERSWCQNSRTAHLKPEDPKFQMRGTEVGIMLALPWPLLRFYWRDAARAPLPCAAL